MTLFKQLALLVSLLFIILLLIVVLADLRRSGDFQQGQLQTTAQDMATTLGIAISNLPDGNDPATVEVLFNAVFDSGYYTRIELRGVDGEVIYQKSQDLNVDGVPQWFIDRVRLQPARGITRVVKGWSQLGQLEIVIHPGFAYSGLYDSLASTLKWFALLLLLALLTLWLVLHFVLKPLQGVKEQADAIHSNRFVRQERIPATVELKRVVEAMNLMVSKVQSIFDEQEKTLDRYQKLLYHDKLTGLGNRRYLVDQLRQSLNDETGRHASMAIVKIAGFDALRDSHGYEVSDDLARILAELLRQRHLGQEAQRVSRFNEDEFAFLGLEDDSAMADFVQALFDAFRELTKTEPKFSSVELQAGVCALEAGAEVGEILSSVDYCLSQAATGGAFAIVCKLSTNLDLPQGKMQWRAWLNSVLQSKQLFLVGQLAIGGDGAPVHRELFVRVSNAMDQVVPASAFMPMASILGMSLDIDREVFRLVTARKNLAADVPLAINLSAAFFELAGAQEEFEQLLLGCEQSDVRLCIEASHHTLVHNPVMCGKIADRVHRHQHQFGIDNLDLGQSLQLLQSAQFDYVKVNAQTLHEMANKDLSAGFQALKTMTDTLDISIIAVGVDSQAVFDQLKALGIPIMQGNFLDAPKAI